MLGLKIIKNIMRKYKKNNTKYENKQDTEELLFLW